MDRRIGAKAAAALVALAACAAPAASHPDVADTGGDSGAANPLPAGCEDAPEAFSELRVEQTAVPMVLRVTWETASAGPGSLSWEMADGTTGRSAEGEAGRTHEALVVGVPAESDLWVVPRLEQGDRSLCGAPVAARTAVLDPRVPSTSLALDDATLLDGGFVLAPILSLERSWVAAFDGAGRMVWILDPTPLSPHPSPVFRAEADPAGRGVWFNSQGGASFEDGAVTLVSWAGELIEQHLVAGAHTDFTLLPDGGFAVLGWSTREFDGRMLLGDTVVRVSAEGDQTVVWDAFDQFEPDLSRTYAQGFLPREPRVEDWSHGNGLSYDAHADEFLISVAGVNAVTRVDGTTGAPVWTLGLAYDDFEPIGTSPLIESPHSVAVTDDGVLVFNRRDWVGGTSCSEATRIALDEDAGTAEAVWAYTGEDCLHVGFLGGAEPLPSGGVLVSWSAAARLDVADPEGATPWSLRVELGNGFGFSTWTPALGAPVPE